MDFKHNFCESRLNNNEGPELLNSYSSLIISIVPLFFGFPKNYLLYNMSILFMLNGIGSFIYHYNLNWIGKHFDEISMILLTYFGIYILLIIYFDGNNYYINNFNIMNNTLLLIFLSFNTIPSFDKYFPTLFGIYVSFAIILIFLNMNKPGIKSSKWTRYLTISGIGCISWIISECNCNHITKYGHVIWHFLFPLGFYKLILSLDSYMINL